MTQFDGPRAADFDNLRALNLAFLERLGHADCGFGSGLDREVIAGLAQLRAQQARRLADVPFLLASLREDDRALWDELFRADPTRDLLEPHPSAALDNGFCAAVMGFVWTLARENAHALRLMSGAPLSWCEDLARVPLVHLLERTGRYPGLLCLRRGDDVPLWRQLLAAGVSDDLGVRRAIHLSAMQMLITKPAGAPVPWASAACRRRSPGISMAREPKPFSGG